MKKTILKHFHRPLGLPAFIAPSGLLLTGSKHSITRRVKFRPNCNYNLGDSDQFDWNKLFGVCFGIRGIHRNSLRFGWRYNTDKGCIELCTIVYREDDVPQRVYREDVALNQWCNFDLSYRVEPYYIGYDFRINGRTVHSGIMPTPGALCYFGCGLYFGGHLRAPKTMTVDICKA